MALPDPLINTKDIAPGAVTFQARLGAAPQGKASERRIQVIFPTVNAPVPIVHNLGRKPSGYVVVSRDRAGRIYNDVPLSCDRRTLVLKCDVAGTQAEVVVR